MPGEFKPPIGLRNPHIQSLLNSSVIRKRVVNRRARDLLAAEQEWILDGGSGIRLLGHYSSQPDSRGTVVLLHGWEGSSGSNYVLGLGTRLFAQGFNVFRLNFRDHGETHHLNPGLFHSCRLDEVIHALGDMQQRTGAQDWHIVGYSLGGNFALRVALHGPGQGLSIGSVFSVCPVVNPANVLVAMETGPSFYENYYIRKWGRSVRKKRDHFPERYDCDDWYELIGMRARTEYFATRYYNFPTVEDYFEGYSIAGDRMLDLAVPGILLTAADDPVVPESDVLGLPEISGLEILITPRGGHCGYLKNWKLESWAEDLFLKYLNGTRLQGCRR